MGIVGRIESMLWARRQKKIDPLKYSLILNEKGFEYGTSFLNSPISKSTYIESFITDTGIQSCGLYFKVVEYDDENSDDAGEGRVINLCRISMERPEYITGFDETFKLDENQKRNMILFFNRKAGDNNTFWEYMFYTMNTPRHFTEKFPKLEVLPMPDYTLLN